MIPIISLLIVISLSILLTRIATVALTLTGLSREAARFQARSALTGTGFTTAEAEKAVGHPVRRRIILFLMLLGNAGIVTAVSSLILGFVRTDDGGGLWLKVGLLVAGVCLLWLLALSQWVDRHLSHLIEWALKRYTTIDVRDYSSLMHLGGDYRIAELNVEPDDWLAEKTLAETRLRDEGIVVLGIERPDGTYVGAPRPDGQIQVRDTLLLYGRASALEQLDSRSDNFTGEIQHEHAVARQQRIEVETQQQLNHA